MYRQLEQERQLKIMETAKSELHRKGYWKPLEELRASEKYQKAIMDWHTKNVDSISKVNVQLAAHTPFDSYEEDVFGNIAIAIAECIALIEITTENEMTVRENIEMLLKQEMLLIVVEMKCADIAKTLIRNAIAFEGAFPNWFVEI